MIAVRLGLVLALLYAGCDQNTDTGTRPSETVNRRFVTEPTPTVIIVDKEQPFVAGTRGMANLGNTCYFNSALQILTHSEPFIREFEALKLQDLISIEPESKLPQLVKNLLANHWENSKTAIDPTELFNELSRLDPVFFRLGVVNDANEMLFQLFTALNQQLFGIPHNPVELFRFQARLTRNRAEGGDPMVQNDPLMSLDVGFLPQDEKGVDLQTLVERYSERREWREEVPAPVIFGSEQSVLYSTPTLLLVNLQRGQGMSKLHYPITFPRELVIQAEGASPVRYTLVGVVHHSGKSGRGGHYYSDLYHYPSKSWYRANDSVVRKLETDFPAQGSETARLFLYQLV